MDRDELVELAETLRPELPMLAPEAAGKLDVLLDRIRSGEPVDDDVFELLTSTKPLRQRMNEVLAVDENVEKGSGYQEMPGHGEPVAAETYVCPQGDYRYPVLVVGESIPLCPKHNLPLVAC